MQRTLLYNARVRTLDPQCPSVEAVLVEGERIAAVGSAAQALRLAPPGTRTVDLQGRCVIPGFNDSHIHVVAMADYLSEPNLRGLDAGEIVASLREHYREARPGQTLYALGWDYPACPSPHRRVLDAAFPDNPVVLVQFSGHGMWLNGRALARFRIGRRTPDPPGGTILRDPDGEPNGILRDRAAEPVHQARFADMHFNRTRHRALLDRALDELRCVGVTSVQDNTWVYTTVRLLNRLRRQGRLSCRFSCWSLGARPWLVRLMQLQRFDEYWVRRGPRKYFLDGTFSTRSAWLLEPYADEPNNCGKQGVTAGELERILSTAARRRRRTAFHAIGDRAVREFLDALERVQARFPGARELRPRLEHAQLIDPADIPRLARLGVVISAQPGAMDTPEKDAALLGRERAARAYPYRALLDAGVPLAFGSDMPGEASYNPLVGIHNAVNPPGGAPGDSPPAARRAITPLEAVSAYTLGSAYAEFQEGEKGTIEPGKLADLVVLSADPLTAPRESIRDIVVEMTMVGGKVVFQQ